MVAKQADGISSSAQSAQSAQPSPVQLRSTTSNGQGANANGNASAQAMHAVVDVIKAAQRMIVARIDLAQLQAKDAAQSAAMLAGAAAIGAFGWVVLMAAAVAAMAGPLPLSVALLIVAGVHLLGAAVLFIVAKRKARPGHSTLSPAEDEVKRPSSKASARAANVNDAMHLRSVP